VRLRAERRERELTRLVCIGYGDIGANGNTTIKTPNVDRLASEGVLLTQHLVASPMCTPSRAALLTGRHAVRLGMSGSKIARVMPSPATPGGISLEETTISSMLKAAGYLTGTRTSTRRSRARKP
jgi:arylsulfatase A-like enzyme